MDGCMEGAAVRRCSLGRSDARLDEGIRYFGERYSSSTTQDDEAKSSFLANEFYFHRVGRPS